MGPITEVYGFGIIFLILLKKYFLDKLRVNKYFLLLITYVLSVIILTITEYLGGSILNLIFDIDMWNYTKKTFNMGKYICLELSLVWGILGVIYIYYIKSFTDKIVKLIPKITTCIFIVINLVDTALTLLLR